MITAKISTCAFNGIDVIPITVEVQVMSGLPKFAIVGLADKAVVEARERIASAFRAMGTAIPAKRIVVNLAPADLEKIGTHYDLPIALGIMCSLDYIQQENLDKFLVLGELGLDGNIASVSGVLPAGMYAVNNGLGIICPATCGAEALWSGNDNILAAHSLLQLVNHFNGNQIIPAPALMSSDSDAIDAAKKQKYAVDFCEVKGQEFAKRALEIAAAGGHNVLFVGPPGVGKSMLAERFHTILPPLVPQEIIEVSTIHSIAGMLARKSIQVERPFRAPHHTASTIALSGGGSRAYPGEVSLAHKGVLFLDELPEFNSQALEVLRQPLETGKITIARANSHITYPADFQLIAAMNPCKCGHFGDAELACSSAPLCAIKYQGKISGPIYDRIDMFVDLKPTPPWQLKDIADGEKSRTILERVLTAKEFANQRTPGVINKNLSGQMFDRVMERIATDALAMLVKSAEKMHISARGYNKVLKVARTIADLDTSVNIELRHISEALSYRKRDVKV
ncbi:MAG: YifB family Mg chelatase-like AAA ATPase [Rickettsiales bacterium]|jgi:magnesium chelatase family protein|nr:YifB family Mg chelatase-like AAA ATPase [Rickettsiales bacterium]